MHAIKTPTRDFLIYSLMRVIFNDDADAIQVSMRGEEDTFLAGGYAEAFRKSFAAAMNIPAIRHDFVPRDCDGGLVIGRVDRSKPVWGPYVDEKWMKENGPVADGEWDATFITAGGQEIHLGKATDLVIA